MTGPALRRPCAPRGTYHQPMDTPMLERLVRLAMAEAQVAADRGDAPFGAVLSTRDGTVLLARANAQVSSVDPTAHAEIELIRAAALDQGRSTLDGLVVATNAEPCSMCLSALVKSRAATVVYGAPHEAHIDPSISAAEVVERSTHPLDLIGGILATECASQVRAARAGSTGPAPD